MRYLNVNEIMESEHFREWCEGLGLDPNEHESYLAYIANLGE